MILNRELKDLSVSYPLIAMDLIEPLQSQKRLPHFTERVRAVASTSSLPPEEGCGEVPHISLSSYKNISPQFLSDAPFDCRNYFQKCFFRHKKSGRLVPFICKQWKCAHCRLILHRRFVESVQAAALRENLRVFITLTLPQAGFESKDSGRRLTALFDKFLKRLKRKWGCSFRYVRVLEQHRSGFVHCHIICNSFVAKEWLNQAWASVGGGRTNVKFVDMHNGAAYIAKYLGKGDDEFRLFEEKWTKKFAGSKGIFEKIVKTKAEWELIYEGNFGSVVIDVGSHWFFSFLVCFYNQVDVLKHCG